MKRGPHKLFLILLALALAVAPLRGAWATADTLPAEATDSKASHCEQMQHGNPADIPMHGMQTGQDTPAKGAGPCSHDCSCSCCDTACNACVHATPAIPGTIIVLSGSTAGTPNSTAARVFPERPATPLLHPPA